MNLKKFISGISALAIAASAFAGLAVTASAELLGNTDKTTGFMTQFSDPFTLNEGESASFEFTNYAGTDVWNNWVACVHKPGASTAWNKANYYSALRADYWELVTESNSAVGRDYSLFSTDGNYISLDEAKVVTTFTYESGSVKTHVDITPKNSAATYYEEFTAGGITGSAEVFLSVDNSYINIKKTVSPDGTVTELGNTVPVSNAGFESDIVAGGSWKYNNSSTWVTEGTASLSDTTYYSGAKSLLLGDGTTNNGYAGIRGINLKAGVTYTVSFYAKGSGNVFVSLSKTNSYVQEYICNNTYLYDTVALSGDGWAKYDVTYHTDTDREVCLRFKSANAYIDNVSIAYDYEAAKSFTTTFSTPANAEITIKDSNNSTVDTITANSSGSATKILPVGTYTASTDGNLSKSFTVNGVTSVGMIPITSLQVKYVYNSSTIETVNVPVQGLYVGDPYTYYSSNYINKNGTYYVVGDDYVTDGTNTYSTNDSNINGSIKKSITLAADNEITYNVALTTSGTIVYFGEGSQVLNSTAHSSKHDDSRYIASGGTVEYENTYASGIGFYDITETGVYQVTMAIAAGAGRGDAIFASSSAASAVSSYDALNADNSVLYGKINNSRNGYSVVKTVTLNSGDRLTIKGYGNTNKSQFTTDNIDYVVVRKLSNTVTVANTTGGTVTSDKPYAKPNETVTLTVDPADGYELDSISGVEATKVDDTTYTFIMPATAVTVSATFKSTVVEPTVSIADFDSHTITYNGADYTAAKLLVNVVGSVSGIRVYYGEAYRDATDMSVITGGTILLGAIVESGVTVDSNTFTVEAIN